MTKITIPAKAFSLSMSCIYQQAAILARQLVNFAMK